MITKIGEYLKLLPAGLKNAEQVIEGIINNVKLQNGNLTEKEKDIIIQRRIICKACPFMSKNAQALGVYITQRNEEHCIHCGCITDLKTATLTANCGIETYNKNNPATQLDLKWTKV